MVILMQSLKNLEFEKTPIYMINGRDDALNEVNLTETQRFLSDNISKLKIKHILETYVKN